MRRSFSTYEALRKHCANDIVQRDTTRRGVKLNPHLKHPQHILAVSGCRSGLDYARDLLASERSAIVSATGFPKTPFAL